MFIIKKLRRIGQRQTFKVKTYGGIFNNKVKRLDDGWSMSRFHWFYVDEDCDINSIYESKYRLIKDRISDGFDGSDNYSVFTRDSDFVDIHTEVVEIDVGNPSIQDLMKDMNAEEFKEWFHDRVSTTTIHV